MPVQAFMDGDVDGAQRRNLEAALRAWWSELFRVADVGIDEDFFMLGGGPVMAETIRKKIRDTYRVDIPAEDFYDARTIAKMADYVQIHQAAAESWCIVPIRAAGTRKPLFLVHGIGGNVLGFFGLVKHLPASQPVYGVQAQSLQPGERIHVSLEDMAAHYVREIRRVQPHGPYAFLGLSFGGLVAYEMARQLHAAGETVGLLGMLDTWQPSYMKRLPNPGSWPVRVFQRLRLVWLGMRRLNLPHKMIYLRNRLRNRALRVFYRYLAARGGGKISESMKSVRDINWIAGIQYPVLPYPGQVTLFRATGENDWRLPKDLGWGAVAGGGVELHQLPGDHGQVLAEPNVSLLAEELDECLRRMNIDVRMI
jgi:thioesterase domain-containing protein